MLYGFSIPAYYSKGIRTYLTLKYSLSDKIDIWLRYAQTSYADKTEIGSGLALIDGNKKSLAEMSGIFFMTDSPQLEQKFIRLSLRAY